MTSNTLQPRIDSSEFRQCWDLISERHDQIRGILHAIRTSDGLEPIDADTLGGAEHFLRDISTALARLDEWRQCVPELASKPGPSDELIDYDPAESRLRDRAAALGLELLTIHPIATGEAEPRYAIAEGATILHNGLTAAGAAEILAAEATPDRDGTSRRESVEIPLSDTEVAAQLERLDWTVLKNANNPPERPQWTVETVVNSSDELRDLLSKLQGGETVSFTRPEIHETWQTFHTIEQLALSIYEYEAEPNEFTSGTAWAIIGLAKSGRVPFER